MMISIVASAQSSSRQIIVLNDGVNANSQAPGIARAYGLEISYSYRNVLNGFAAVVPAGRLNALSNDPRVAYVEEDLLMSIAAQEIPTGIDRAFVDQAALDIDGADDFRVDVDVAIIDTGIDFEHPDLNVVGGTDCTLASGRGPFATRYCGGPGEGTGGDDDHYHGTHVGGTVGALDNGIGVVGVAPGARLWAVKVLGADGSGYTSGIIAGIDWVVARGDIEVANMSLGGSGISTAYETAIDNAVANGVVMVVAAGNSNADANNYSPAFVPSAITVSALADFDGLEGALGSPTCRADEDDTLANFSNFGSAVDIAAPGVCILSTYPLEQGEYASISGTSMAAPHVAGAAALLTSGNNAPANAADVQAIRDQLVNSGNFNWTDDSGDGIKEPLLDLTGVSGSLVANDGGGDPPPPPPSDATSYTVSLSGVALNQGGSWSSEVTISATADTGASVEGIQVFGSFDQGGDVNCTTGSDGTCVVSSNTVRKKDVSTITYTLQAADDTIGSLVFDDAGSDSVELVSK